MSTALAAGAYLHHMQLQSSDPAQLAAFYADAMNMTVQQLEGGDWLCEGPQRRVLFTQGQNKMLSYAGFGCRDVEGVAAIRKRAATGRCRNLFLHPARSSDQRRLPSGTRTAT